VVGTVANSYAVGYLQTHNVRVKTFDKRDEMFQALIEQRVDAVVWESPILRYYILHQGQGRVMLVGREFYSGPVSFLLPPDSPLRRQINIALLALHDNGTYKQLHKKWFGDL
jgi:polar amino acid transport system substrate-binding protein